MKAILGIVAIQVLILATCALLGAKAVSFHRKYAVAHADASRFLREHRLDADITEWPNSPATLFLQAQEWTLNALVAVLASFALSGVAAFLVRRKKWVLIPLPLATLAVWVFVSFQTGMRF